MNVKKIQKRQKKFCEKMLAAMLVFCRAIWYNTGEMKKILKGILSIICTGTLFAGLCAETAALLPASAAEAEGGARAEQTLTGETLSLLLPSSYEQYLGLSAVNGISVKGSYIAVADGNGIYIYDGTAYRRYEHVSEVVQLELNGENTLYFLDENGYLYTLDCAAETLTGENYGITCSSFTLGNNTVYYARSVTTRTNIYDEHSPDSPLVTLSAAVTNVPSLAYADGKLFYTDGQYFNIWDTEAGENMGTYSLTAEIYDIAVAGTLLYYTDKNNLYSYDFSSEQFGETHRAEGAAYGALSLDGSYLYVADNADESAKIRRFDTAEGAFTDYEIGTSSESDNRLSAATQSIVAGEYLVIADENRLRLYNYAEGTYAAFDCAITPAYIASDGSSILVADATTVCAYDFQGAQLLSASTGFIGNIAGIAAAKGGDYFLVTGNHVFYRIDAEEFTLSGPIYKSSASPKALTADIYGDLYILYDDNEVYRFTPEEFMSQNAGGTLCFSFGSAISDIAVDFDGNIYGLSGKTLQCSDGSEYTIDDAGCVFESDATLRDFAFGYETGTVYFLYDDYILTTEAIDLPHLGALETGDAYRTIFEEPSGADGVVPVVTLNEDAVLLQFSLEELTADAEYFPYLGYTCGNAGVNALVLGEISIHSLDYYIVTIFDPGARDYTAGLVLRSACTVVDEDDYASDPEAFADGAGYITNAIPLYKYPYLTDRLTLTTLEKNAVVSVLKELSLGDTLMDYDYYYIGYTDANGETLYGYVPKNFVRGFRGTTEENVSVYYRTLHSDEDVTAVSADNRTITLEAGRDYAVAVYETDDENVVFIAYEENGVTYYATVSADSFRTGTTDGLRYFLVTLLLILDVILVVNYIIFRKKE